MKKVIWILLGAALIVLVWYLFVRPYEFEVNFKARTLPGDIIQTIRIWDRSMDDSEIMKVDSLFGLTQQIVWQNRRYVYRWSFEIIDDSTARVNIKITQPGRSILNKILIPVTNQHIEQDAADIARQFYDLLNVHLKITDVKVLGEGEITPGFCACRTIETRQVEKANGMMKEYGVLTSFISDFDLRTNGPPIIKVIKWNHTLGELKYDFCFPIVKTDSLPINNSITYKDFKSERVLRAVYHGNYITSDRAWYALFRFAESNGYKAVGLPVEYFYDNPNLGLNEKDWRAEVFLPIQ
jgi:effector-binding domain-containing protein